MWKYARVLNIFSHLPSIYNYGYEYLWKLLNDFSHAKQGNGNYVNRVGYDLEKLNISKLFDGQLYLFHPKDTLHFHSEVFHSKMIELKTDALEPHAQQSYDLSSTSRLHSYTWPILLLRTRRNDTPRGCTAESSFFFRLTLKARKKDGRGAIRILQIRNSFLAFDPLALTPWHQVGCGSVQDELIGD